MFTRAVEIRAKPGKARELALTIYEKALPILKRQRGFLDEVVLVSDTDPDHILALSFWKKQEDAELYNREQYSKINGLVLHLLESAPVVRTFNVDVSTKHKIAPRRAA